MNNTVIRQAAVFFIWFVLAVCSHAAGWYLFDVSNVSLGHAVFISGWLTGLYMAAFVINICRGYQTAWVYYFSFLWFPLLAPWILELLHEVFG